MCMVVWLLIKSKIEVKFIIAMIVSNLWLKSIPQFGVEDFGEGFNPFYPPHILAQLHTSPRINVVFSVLQECFGVVFGDVFNYDNLPYNHFIKQFIGF